MSDRDKFYAGIFWQRRLRGGWRIDHTSDGYPLLCYDLPVPMITIPKGRALDLLRTNPHDAEAVRRLLSSFAVLFSGTINQHAALWIACGLGGRRE